MGIVERQNRSFETSFMPGRSFGSLADFNAQFTGWLTIANARVVRTIRAGPVDLLDTDKAAMLTLPPVAPAVEWVNRVRLGRDYDVRVDSSDYSVDPAVTGRFVDVTADLAEVEARHEGASSPPTTACRHATRQSPTRPPSSRRKCCARSFRRFGGQRIHTRG